MKILLDENMPHNLRHELADHSVATVAFMGWQGTRNGDLLRRAEVEGFDAFITFDRGFEYQQNLSLLPLTVVLLVPRSRKPEDLRHILPQLLSALESAPVRRFIRVQAVTGDTKDSV